MFSALLETDREVESPLPKLRPHGDACLPVTMPCPEVTEFQNFTGHPGRIATLRIGGISRRLRCA